MTLAKTTYNILSLPIEASLRTIPEAARLVENASNYTAHKVAGYYQNHPSNNLLYNGSVIVSCISLSHTNQLARNIRLIATSSIDDLFHSPKKE